MKPDQSQDFYNSNDIEYEDIIQEVARILPSTAQQTYKYQGIQVKFPYEAYSCQANLMEAIITGVESSENCLLESPTGTGKTVALLCSLLAWQENAEGKSSQSPHKKLKTEESKENQDPRGPLIFYATRSVLLIEQIISQLRQTSYASIPMGILASMEATCNNESTAPTRQDAPDITPNEVGLEDHWCQYNPEAFGWLKHLRAQESQAWNIQDLKGFCRTKKTCPYYELLNVWREGYPKIVFCHYNFLLHGDIRSALGINLENSIVVFDEGHNVEGTCRKITSSLEDDSTSWLAANKLLTIWATLEEILDHVSVPPGKRECLQNLRDAIHRFWDYLQKKIATKENREKYLIQRLLKDMRAIGFGESDIQKLRTDFITAKNIPSLPQARKAKLKRAMTKIADLLRILGFLHTGSPEECDYKIEVVTKKKEESLEVEMVINCVNPAVGFKPMKEARSVIITSGTLSPLTTFASELGMTFHHQLSEHHVIQPNRVFSRIIDTYETDSTNSMKFSCGLLNTDKNKHADEKNQLAMILLKICSSVSHGVVVFLPTKSDVEGLKVLWEENKHLGTITKQPFFEGTEMNLKGAEEMLKEYREKAETSKGAILFASMRGRFSEGVDFKGNHARALVAVGISFLPKEEAKEEFHNSKGKEESDFPTFWDWYNGNAIRALNQAIGRIIRRHDDWGAIFIVDKRFREDRYRGLLPRWIEVTLQRNQTPMDVMAFTEVLPDLDTFVGTITVAA